MLDADAVADRDKATDELAKLGKAAEPALRKALDGCLSAEAGLRVKVLLDRLSNVAPETLRWLRAVEMLEYAGTPEARQLLTMLAKDAPAAPVQEEAKASLERVGHRS